MTSLLHPPWENPRSVTAYSTIEVPAVGSSYARLVPAGVRVMGSSASVCGLMLCLLLFLIVGWSDAGTVRTPILIIPGYTGSQMEARVSSGPCRTGGDAPVLLWVNERQWRCVDQLELLYDSSNNSYSNLKGVSTAVPGFGDTSTVECLANRTSPSCSMGGTVDYFRTFVQYFVAKGYQRGVDIRAAPYDWRYAGDNHDYQGYYTRVTELIEEMYQTNGQQRVAVVAHSMGGPTSLYLFNRKATSGWKDKFVRAYITLSADFAGSSFALEAVLSATYPSFFSPQVARSFQSLYWIMPRYSIYKGEVLVETPKANYNASAYEDLFALAGYPAGWSKYKPTSSLTTYAFPGVEMHCFHGSDLPTPRAYKFSTENLSDKPVLITGAGDGLVNRISLETCLQWSGSPGFQHRAFSGVDHVGMVKDEQVLNAIASVVLSSD